MTEEFSFLEDTALADIAFEATGNTPEELFQASARALFETMVDPNGVRPTLQRIIRLRHTEIDQLLFDWLSELIYLKDADCVLFGCFQIRLHHGKEWELEAIAQGVEIDPPSHALRADVKAVTYHQFDVSQSDDGRWKARIVLDI